MNFRYRKIILFLILSFIIILLLFSNIKGLGLQLVLDNFGINVRIHFSGEVNDEKFDSYGENNSVVLSNSVKILKDNYNGYDFYSLEDGTKLCEVPNNMPINFWSDENKIYIVEHFYIERYTEYSSSLFHKGDVLLSYDLTSNKVTKHYETEKGVWILFGNEDELMFFDSKNSKIDIRSVSTGRVLHTVCLLEDIKNDIYFDIYNDYVVVRTDANRYETIYLT